MERRFHRLCCLCTAAHHAFELGAGGGLVFQRLLGLRRSLLLWSGLLTTWSVGAASTRSGWEKPRAVAAGMSLGGALIHFVVWPWARPGLPMLTTFSFKAAAQLANITDCPCRGVRAESS